MKKQHYSVTINAPRAKVWDTMLNDATYREWTRGFNEGGSYYEGNWEQGSEIRFLGLDATTGKVGGMYAQVRENRPHEYISVEHLGIIDDGKVDTTSDEVKKWTPAHENYTFVERDGGTEVGVELDVAEEHAGFFDETWPQALQALKELAEK